MTLPSYTCANPACGKVAKAKGKVIATGGRRKPGEPHPHHVVNRVLLPIGWRPIDTPEGRKHCCSDACFRVVYQETARPALEEPRKRHSASGQVRCDICAPLRCSKAP